MRLVLTRLGPRFIVSAFALLGFVSVPLGERTGYQHLRAILRTPEASLALSELGVAFTRLRGKLLEPDGAAPSNHKAALREPLALPAFSAPTAPALSPPALAMTALPAPALLLTKPGDMGAPLCGAPQASSHPGVAYGGFPQ
jgi:hypothetical protein